MSQREDDLRVLGELLDQHADELTSVEVEAFAGMRFDLTAYGKDTLGARTFQQLTVPRRDWVTKVHQRIVPDYANLVSRGLVPKGTPTTESKALDAMLAGPKVLRPPPLPKSGGGPQRASRRHCGRADEGCYAFVNGDCSCECCR